MDAPFAPITIPAIDAEGRLYPVEKMAAHRRGLLHVAISVFLFDRVGRLLIQRRAHGKYHCGGLWANTVCSHPHYGEEVAAAATRRLGEELGAAAPLRAQGVFDYRAEVGHGLIEHERVHMFRGDVDAARFPLDPDPAEVAETRWVDRAALLSEIAARPGAFTPWFRIYAGRWPAFDFGAAAPAGA
jgi:isopentenyl-diphosphate delta-isomerase